VVDTLLAVVLAVEEIQALELQVQVELVEAV